jgi:peptide/nickel transport system permease protein
MHKEDQPMIKYVLGRLLALIPIILALIFVVFTILYFTPGDATAVILGNEYTPELSAQKAAELGLDKPFFVQFFNYVFGLVRGDFGMSYITRAPVGDELAARFPNTLKLVLLAMAFCVALGVPIGIYSGTKPNSIFSILTMIAALLGISFPIFFLGMLLILFFSRVLGWFDPYFVDNSFRNFILPALALGANYMANIMRITRSSMLESIRQDFVRTAKAKGVSKRNVIYKHALPNAIMPTITVIGMDIGFLLGGAVLTETVFAIPGTGRMLVSAINSRDTPSVLGCLVVMAICVAISSLIVDLIYAYIDPRIKAQYKAGRVH